MKRKSSYKDTLNQYFSDLVHSSIVKSKEDRLSTLRNISETCLVFFTSYLLDLEKKNGLTVFEEKRNQVLNAHPKMWEEWDKKLSEESKFIRVAIENFKRTDREWWEKEFGWEAKSRLDKHTYDKDRILNEYVESKIDVAIAAIEDLGYQLDVVNDREKPRMNQVMLSYGFSVLKDNLPDIMERAVLNYYDCRTQVQAVYELLMIREEFSKIADSKESEVKEAYKKAVSKKARKSIYCMDMLYDEVDYLQGKGLYEIASTPVDWKSVGKHSSVQAFEQDLKILYRAATFLDGQFIQVLDAFDRLCRYLGKRQSHWEIKKPFIE